VCFYKMFIFLHLTCGVLFDSCNTTMKSLRVIFEKKVVDVVDRMSFLSTSS
jgi:hypothetical protein